MPELVDVPKNWGEMKDFNVNAFIQVIDEYMRADETARALWVIDNLPAYFRDFPPKEIIHIKNEILKRVATPGFYANSNDDLMIDPVNQHGMDAALRTQLILRDVEWFNKEGFTPHIIDYGPGEYWLPMLLKRHSMKFTYRSIGLSSKAFELASPYFKEHVQMHDGSSPIMFIACEIIEHLWQEQEIKTEMLRACGLADIVHVSTPKYTFGWNCLDWRKDKADVGHLRAYTPNEFMVVVANMFREYHPAFYDHYVMHMRLTNKETPVPGLLDRVLINP